MKVRVSTADVANIALEVLDVYRVEADDGGEKADISLSQPITKVKWTFRFFKVRLRMVEGLEQGVDVFLVGLLCSGSRSVSDASIEKIDIRCKARLIHAVVDVVVSPFIRLHDLSLQVFGKQVNSLVLLRQEMVECCVEHPDDLARLVGHDAVLLDIIQCRNRESAFIILVDLEVDVAKMSEPLVDWIRSHIFARFFLVGSGKSPAFLEHLPVNRSVGDEFLETFQFPYN